MTPEKIYICQNTKDCFGGQTFSQEPFEKSVEYMRLSPKEKSYIASALFLYSKKIYGELSVASRKCTEWRVDEDMDATERAITRVHEVLDLEKRFTGNE